METAFHPGSICSVDRLLRTCCACLAVLFAVLLEGGAASVSLVLSEVSPSTRDSLTDGFGGHPDWIELFNPSSEDVELAGWSVGGAKDSTKRVWTFAGGRIRAGGYGLLLASGRGVVDALGNQHGGFTLKDLDGMVYLFPPGDATVGWVDSLNIPELPADRTYGRVQVFQTNQVLVSGVSELRLRIPSADAGGGSEPSAAWKGGSGFDDSGWLSVRGPIGFNSGAAAGTGVVNRALGAVVATSGETWPGLDASNLTDGRLDTFTHNLTPTTDFSYWVDLGDTYALETIEVLNRADGCCPDRLSNYTVSVHPDVGGVAGPASWSAAVRTSGSNSGVGGKDVLTRRLDNGGTFAGRFVRVQNRVDGGDRYLQMAELRVFAGPPSYAGLVRYDVGGMMRGKASDAYVRIPVVLNEDPAGRQGLVRLRYDDGVVVYLNGEELIRRNVPVGGVPLGSVATAEHSGLAVESALFAGSMLRRGTNFFSIHALNAGRTNDDFLVDLEMELRLLSSGAAGVMAKASPGVANGAGRFDGIAEIPEFSESRGFRKGPMNLVIRCPDPLGMLIYTTNGAAPSLSVGVQVATGSTGVVVRMDRTTVVRAACFRTGYEPSSVVTHTYLFLDDVLKQPAKPAGFPVTWNGFAADYEMDPDVVRDPAYAGEMETALRSIPSLSISLAADDLFGAAKGIYANSEAVGDAWERAVSVELILPDGSTGFAENAGLRLWGTGWRPHSSSPKHSMQVKFQDQYGVKKLRYPWFADAPVAEFDNVVLRAQGSRSWSDFRTPDIEQAQYIHDSWARDTRRDMGTVEGKATYVHLYLNGLYWGLYNPVEKTDEGFAEVNYGGDKSEYDVVTRRFEAEADAGDLTAWRKMFQIARSGLGSPDRYAELLQYLDVDDFIDYMMVNQYGTNHDGPTSNGNNMRAIHRRTEDGRFRFHVWDMEYTFWQAQENNLSANVADSPAELFQLLRLNPEFRLRYADRAQRHLLGDGALTPEKAARRWQARADEIFSAVLGESARWGDVRRAAPYTRNVEWYAELQRLFQEYFPVRSALLLQQYREAGLFPGVDAPILVPGAGEVALGTVLEFAPQNGEVYYTLDGSDPRLPGGEPAPGAKRMEPSRTLVSLENPVRVWVGAGEGLPAGWSEEAFVDGAWLSGGGALGVDTASLQSAIAVGLQNATADYSESGRSVAQVIDSNPRSTGWGLFEPDFQGKSHGGVAVFETVTDAGYPEGTELAFTLQFGAGGRQNLGRYRLSFTTDSRNAFADGKATRGDVVATWEILQPIRAESTGGATLKIMPDGSIQAGGKNPSSDTNRVVCVTPRSGITGIRIEAMEDLTLPNRGPGRSDAGAMVLTDLTLQAAPARWEHLMDAGWGAMLASAVSGGGGGKLVLVRIPFGVGAGLEAARLELRSRYSDGWVAWLNGREIGRRNAIGVPGGGGVFRMESSRGRNQSLIWDEPLDVTGGLGSLKEGQNVLAIAIPSEALLDGSFLGQFELVAIRGGAIELADNAVVSARSRVGGEWSAMQRAVYSVRNTIQLSEVMYHPPDAGLVSGDEYEFVELVNRGTTAVDVSGYTFLSGITFTFPKNSVMAAGERVVLVRNQARFLEAHPGVAVRGVYSGRLDNGGESLVLTRPDGRVVFEVGYRDGAPWPVTPDGFGFSLVPKVETVASSGNPADWRASAALGGSPGALDPEPGIPPVRINEIRTAADERGLDAIELFNPTGAAADIGGWYLTDDAAQPRKYRIPLGTKVEAGGYGVFYSSQFGSVEQGTNAFRLSARGQDDVFVFSANAAGELTGYSHGFRLEPSPLGVTLGRAVLSTGEEVLVPLEGTTLGQTNGVPWVEPLKISEIQYHAAPGDVEFLEIENWSGSAVALHAVGQVTNTWRIRGLGFAFPPGLELGAGSRMLVVATDPSVFRKQYGVDGSVLVVGPYLGSLRNAGEELVLERPEMDYWVAVDRVRFDDREPWPLLADGYGPSLQRAEGGGLGMDPGSWEAAAPTPGGLRRVTGVPVISRGPLDVDGIAGSVARMLVEAVGEGALRYQWRHDGTNMPGYTNAVMELIGLLPRMAGRYQVAVFSEGGAVLSGEALLTVTAPPVILVAPQATQVNLGSNAVLSVRAVDDGSLEYQWRVNGVDIPGATTPTLALGAATSAMNGFYTVVVRSRTGFVVTQPVELRVLTPPVILFQPQSVSVVAGQTVVLYVRVQGSLPLTYKWRRNGALIREETIAVNVSSLVITNIQTAQGGTYSVTVTGLQPPTVTSQNATVTVMQDSDGDGAPDTWEGANGFGLGNPQDGGLDEDKDGMINRDEFVAGTDPRDPLSFLGLDIGVVAGEGGQEAGVELVLNLVAGRSYAIQARSTEGLGGEGEWIRVADYPVRLTNRVERLIRPVTGGGEFYRVVVPARP